MIKRSAFMAFACCVATFASSSAQTAPAPAPQAPAFMSPSPAPINVTGRWQIQDAAAKFSAGGLNLRQVGTTVVGDYANGAGSLSGELATPRRMDATWTDSRGSGWVTAYFSDDGRLVNGEWGFKGRKLSGRFVGSLAGAALPKP